MSQIGIEYEHFVPEAKLNPDWYKNLNFILVGSIEQLKEIMSTPANYIAFDTETTGLDASKDFIVGYSFSFDGKTGYYVPVRHISPPFLGREALEILYEKMKQVKRVFILNLRFDFRIMEYAGFVIEVVS